MKTLIITFSSLLLIFPTVLASVLSDIVHDALPISLPDVFQGTNQTNDYLDSLQIIRSQGYPAEAHSVTTEDGYILSMHRIPGKPGSPAVFLQHGFLGSSADFLIVNRTESIAFMLADLGYDVWFGNFRGNTYSRAHVNLSPDDYRFWDFSWHESGVYDLPAMLTYIVETKKSLLRAYIGFSMGTTTFYVLSSERPDIAGLVESAYHLAPAANLKHTRSPLFKLLSYAEDPLKALFNLVEHGEFLPDDIISKIAAKYFCYSTVLEEKVCANGLFLFIGFDNTQFNYDLMPTFLNHIPAGSSVRQAAHFAQMAKSEYFRQYDYGKEKNLKIYNSPEPPKYNMSRVTTPLALFWGENDWLTTPKDVERIVSHLPHKPISYKVPYKKFDHFDFLVARDVRELVYNQVIDILTKNKLNIKIET